MRSVSVHSSAGGGGFAAGGAFSTGGTEQRIYIGNLDGAKSALDPQKLVPPGLYGIYRPYDDLVLAAGGALELSAGSGGLVKLAGNTLLGRVCKWMAQSQCPGGGEVWTPIGVGSTNLDGSDISYSSGTYYGAVLCCRFETGRVVVVSATGNCVRPPDETQTLDCPAGQSGAVTQARVYTCPGPVAGPWATVSNNCTSCVAPLPETDIESCPAGALSGKITKVTTYACPGPTPQEWTASDSCVYPPPVADCVLPPVNPLTRLISCCPGLIGTITQQKQLSCVNGVPQGDWKNVSNTCRLGENCWYNSGCASGIQCWSTCSPRCN